MIDRTGSGEEEPFTQVKPAQEAIAISDFTHLQLGPGHHLLLPEGTTHSEFLLVADDVIDSFARAEITRQITSVDCSLIVADELQYFGVHGLGPASFPVSFGRLRQGGRHRLPLSRKYGVVSQDWKPKLSRSSAVTLLSSAGGRRRVM